MPLDAHQIQDNTTNDYVSTYTNPTSFQEVDENHLAFVPYPRTDTERTNITNALNAVYANRFHIVPTPKH